MSEILGVVLAGGKGTRMLNQTEIHNKHLMPVYSIKGATPMIWYPISTLIKSGITNILIISSQEHCGDIIELMGDGHRFGAEFTYKIQDHNDTLNRPVGIASALKLSKHFTGNKKFAVILGDNFYEDSFSQEIDDFIKDDYSKSYLFLKDVGKDIKRFGCATIKGDKITKIIEKPDKPESTFAVTGLYLYTEEVYDLTEKCKISDRGELEISHINDFYANNNFLKSKIIKGFWSDMGVPESMIKTSNWIIKKGYEIPFV